MVYSLLLLAIAAAGVYALYIAKLIVVGGKTALALGIKVSGLPETIAQYQPATIGLFGPSSYVLWLGVVTLFLYVPLALYDYIVRREPWHLTLAIFVGLSIWATKNIAYFTSMTTAVILTTFSVFLAEIAKFAMPERRQSRWYYGGALRFGVRQVAALVLVLALLSMHVSIYVINAGFAGRRASTIIDLYRMQFTTIASSELGSVPALSWIQALYYLRSNTSNNSLVVSWWDYGYWISVVARRPSVADGATINETHIRLLAIALSAPEEDSACIVLRHLGGYKAPEVYVAAHALVLAIKSGDKVEFEPLIQGADPAKALSAILRLARMGLEQGLVNKSIEVPIPDKILNYVSVEQGRFPVSIKWDDAGVMNSTLFRIFINGSYVAMKHMFPNSSVSLGYPLLYVSPLLSKHSVPALNTTLYRPAKVFVSQVAHGRLRGGSEYYQFEVVYVFKMDKDKAVELCRAWDP